MNISGITSFRNIPLKYLKDMLADSKLNRSFYGSFSSWQQMMTSEKQLDRINVTGVIVADIGCVLYFHNQYTETTELGVFVYPEQRNKGYANNLFSCMKDFNFKYDNLLSTKETRMQSPTDKLAVKWLGWDEETIFKL